MATALWLRTPLCPRATASYAGNSSAHLIPGRFAMRTSVLVLLAAGWLTTSGLAGEDPGKRELQKFQGTWTLEAFEEGAKKSPAAELKQKRIFFGANQF